MHDHNTEARQQWLRRLQHIDNALPPARDLFLACVGFAALAFIVVGCLAW